MSTLPVTPDDRLIWDTWLAMYRLPVLTVADEVGTFAALSTQSLTTDELAARITVGARALAIHLGCSLAGLRRTARWPLARERGGADLAASGRRRLCRTICCIVCV